MPSLTFESVDTINGGAEYIWRARVPMGWIVRDVSDVCHMEYSQQCGNDPDGYDWRVSITFVFDPLHLWK